MRHRLQADPQVSGLGSCRTYVVPAGVDVCPPRKQAHPAAPSVPGDTEGRSPGLPLPQRHCLPHGGPQAAVVFDRLTVTTVNNTVGAHGSSCRGPCETFRLSNALTALTIRTTLHRKEFYHNSSKRVATAGKTEEKPACSHRLLTLGGADGPLGHMLNRAV